MDAWMTWVIVCILGRVICCIHCLSLSKLGIPMLFVVACVCSLYRMQAVCFCMFLVGYAQTPEPVIHPGRLAQIDLSCVDVP